MATKQGTLVPIERQAGDIAASAPRAAYFMDDPTLAGRYVLGVGAPATEATAWLMDDPTLAGRYVLGDDPADETRIPYLVGSEVIF